MEGKSSGAGATFRMRIGAHRRITLPAQLLEAMAVQTGDTFVVDLVNGTFSFERVSRDNLESEADTATEWEPVRIIDQSERARPVAGKKQFHSDIARMKQTVANYFSGLGVPPEILVAELGKVQVDADEPNDQ